MDAASMHTWRINTLFILVVADVILNGVIFFPLLFLILLFLLLLSAAFFFLLLLSTAFFSLLFLSAAFFSCCYSAPLCRFGGDEQQPRLRTRRALCRSRRPSSCIRAGILLPQHAQPMAPGPVRGKLAICPCTDNKWAPHFTNRTRHQII